jgi:hypothetical protein
MEVHELRENGLCLVHASSFDKTRKSPKSFQIEKSANPSFNQSKPQHTQGGMPRYWTVVARARARERERERERTR